MAKRTGLIVIRNLAYEICKRAPIWAPAIEAAYPGNTSLKAALEALAAACAVWVDEVEAVRDYGD